jgi:hypothetical protein
LVATTLRLQIQIAVAAANTAMAMASIAAVILQPVDCPGAAKGSSTNAGR